MKYLGFNKKGNCVKGLIEVDGMPKTILKMEYAYF